MSIRFHITILVLTLLASCAVIQTTEETSFFTREQPYDSVVRVRLSADLTICEYEDKETKNCEVSHRENFSVGTGFAIGDGKKIATAGHSCKLGKRQRAKMKIQMMVKE